MTGTITIIGAVFAALITGLFSFLRILSDKENNVSRFRLEWIDGLRQEFAALYSAIHDSISLEHLDGEERDELTPREWFELGRESADRSRQNFSRILLRLNPNDVLANYCSLESGLVQAMKKAEASFDNREFEQAGYELEGARLIAAQLLKREWEKVKSGELLYRRIRLATVCALAVTVFSAVLLLFLTY